MFFFILTNLLTKNDLNLNFSIVGGCLFYVVILNYYGNSGFLSLLIPLDLFLSFQYIYDKKNKNSDSGEKQFILRKNKNKNKILNDFVIDQISIKETLDHTFKNIGISAKNP